MKKKYMITVEEKPSKEDMKVVGKLPLGYKNFMMKKAL